MRKTDSSTHNSNKRPLIFWGATGQAKMLHECLRTTEFELAALFDSNDQIKSPFAHIPIFHDETLFTEWLQQIYLSDPVACLVAIGGTHGRVRLELQEKLRLQGLRPVTVKHPTAHIAHNVVIGDGSQILPMACVNADTRVGCAAIINSGAIVEHECTIGDGVHIAPSACLGGVVKVENFASIMIGATVIPRITIGTGAIVGAGAVVIRDVAPYSVVVGNPARVIKTLAADGDGGRNELLEKPRSV